MPAVGRREGYTRSEGGNENYCGNGERETREEEKRASESIQIEVRCIQERVPSSKSEDCKLLSTYICKMMRVKLKVSSQAT